jgi:hypothetical protein
MKWELHISGASAYVWVFAFLPQIFLIYVIMKNSFKESLNPKIVEFLKNFWKSKEDEYKDHPSAESVLYSNDENKNLKKSDDLKNRE